MKKKIWLIVLVVVAAIVGYGAYTFNKTSKLSPRGFASTNFQGTDIKVDYGRPSKRSRLIFGDEKDKPLLAYGKYWRLGANEATEITFSKNVNFAGKPVNAGSYRMYCVPSANTWQLTLNSELGKFGYFEPDYDLDVLKVDVPVEVSPSETEMFTVDFSSDSTAASLNFTWDKVLVRVPIVNQ